jgi:tRNA(Arg) A34 adenosine deaminase TadA
MLPRMTSTDRLWRATPAPWRRCLELAWDSFLEGSTPVGSVITDRDGALVAEGRNRGFGDPDPTEGLAGTYIAHAEINALAALPPGDYPDHTIWSSLEPCFMCSAAVVHSHVGIIRYAAADPLVSGVDRLPSLNSWLGSRWPQRHGPLAGALGSLCALLPVVWLLGQRAGGRVAETYREADPVLFDLAAALSDLRDAGSVTDALAVVLPQLG